MGTRAPTEVGGGVVVSQEKDEIRLVIRGLRRKLLKHAVEC